MSAAAEAAEAARLVRSRWPMVPRIGLILGSGLAALADRVTEAYVLPYAEIPHMPVPAVEGHGCELVLGLLAGCPVAVMRGRVHLYEGWTAAEVVFGVRLMSALGASRLIVTNAAGGLNPAFSPGDLMLISDHVFLPGMAGLNPLRGPNEPELGPRFPAMAGAYDPELRTLAHAVAARRGLTLREGVYVMVAGPSYETPAECRFLRGIGADAVGMSTCPEVVAARHAGLAVLGLSLITNVLTGAPVSHDEVLAVAADASVRLCDLVEALVAALPA